MVANMGTLGAYLSAARRATAVVAIGDVATISGSEK
jgi:hypothetical protein